MAVLRAGSSFLSANGKVLKKEKGGFYVLTYFKTTPFGDNILGFSFDSHFSSTDLVIGDYTYDAVNVHNFTGNLNAGNAVNIEAFDKFSFDLFIMPTVSYGSFVQIHCLGRFLRFDWWDRVFIDRTGGVIDLIGYYNPSQPTHVAGVYERSTQTVRIYIDGELRDTRSGIEVNNLLIRCNLNNNSANSFKVTQWAVRNGDRSNNNGQNFPVPSNPYNINFNT